MAHFLPKKTRVKQNANTSHERSPTHPKFHADPTAYLMPASRGPTNSPANPPSHQLTCFKRMAKGTSAPFPTGCIPAPAASPPSLPPSSTATACWTFATSPEAVTGTGYNAHVQAAVVDRLGLADTGPEWDPARAEEYAAGHTGLLDGEDERATIPHVDTRAMASATGFWSTARGRR